MFTGPVGPVEVFFYWPEAVLGNFYWPGAIGSPLASSPVIDVRLTVECPSTSYHKGIYGLDQAVTESQNCSCQEFSQLSHIASLPYYTSL